MFNVFEQMGLRVAKAFENNIDDEQGWHGARYSSGWRLPFPGCAPRSPPELRLPVNELKAFRHVVVHAYDLQLDPQKLALVLKYAGQVADSLPAIAARFLDSVAVQEQSE